MKERVSEEINIIIIIKIKRKEPIKSDFFHQRIIGLSPQGELPGAPGVAGMRVGRAEKASCLNPWVDGFSKPAVFHDPDALAGEIGQPLASPRFLDAAGFHPEDEARGARLFDFLDIDMSLEAEL